MTISSTRREPGSSASRPEGRARSRKASSLTAALLLALSASLEQALASSGIACVGVDADVELRVVIGSGLAREPVTAMLREGASERSVASDREAGPDSLLFGQSWLDRGRFWLDLTDIEARRTVARLRVQFPPVEEGANAVPRPASGTLVLNRGRVLEVECLPD